uniref:tRNA (guanine(10)-N(2))-methyltransferase TRMT11 n=1 Tax=Hirondellea gigas TaxID=1518452 RepID=A0A2P2I0Z4_9CRUS
MHKAHLANYFNMTKKYLFWCVNEHVDFRIPELKSVASIFKIPLKWIEQPNEDPFVILEMDSESDAQKIVSRCMLVRAGYELWGDGCSMEELHASIRQQPASLIAPHITKDKSFRVRVDGFNKTLHSADKLAKINSLSYLQFEGPVDLCNPTTQLNIIEYYGLDNTDVPEQPYRVFLGRCIGQGGRDLIARYSLKQRNYIGSTSMDAQLSFIMTNLARLEQGNLVLDPFVGTGSVLVSAAHHGAFIWGSDIDFLTLHARTKPTRVKQVERAAHESILSNLEQYGLGSQYLDVAVMDCARTAWRTQPFLDAIITDPPYGIRESTTRVGKEQDKSRDLTTQQKKLRRKQRLQHVRTQEVIDKYNKTSYSGNEDSNDSEDGATEEELANSSGCCPPPNDTLPTINADRCDNRLADNPSLVHYPSKVNYSLSDVYKDLLNFAASYLVVGGRLVFWLPVFRDDYRSDQVPRHPCLELMYNCEQILNCHSSRRLITLQKTRSPKVGERAEAHVEELTDKFREKFFIAAQMTRDERIARKSQFSRDKRGQGLTYRLQNNSKAKHIEQCSAPGPQVSATPEKNTEGNGDICDSVDSSKANFIDNNSCITGVNFGGKLRDENNIQCAKDFLIVEPNNEKRVSEVGTTILVSKFPERKQSLENKLDESVN